MPKRIGRYEAFRQIGAGGMARVYLALQRGLPGKKAALVVVKVLRPEVVEDEHVVSLFTDEARIAMRLEHPNIIRTREVISAPPDYLLAMDFHDGRSLLDVLDRIGRQEFPLDEHIYILTKVLAGLRYAHEFEDERGTPFGIVHRDVSPANVLVSYTGEVRLLDFGIAKATGALAATRDGVVRGKLGYAAPEQCLGQPADPRSDIHAVGVMLWEAIAGRRRVSGETWQSVLQARLDDTEPALEEVCPDAPAELTAIVKKAVARDPGDRYATAKEFQTDLERYLVETRGSATGPARIAAMLKRHFARDRAELHAAIKAYLNSRRRKKAGQVGRMPLPERAAPPLATQNTSQTEVAAPREEQTAPIPVDAALLMLSRGRNETALDSIPTVPPPPPITTTAPLDPVVPTSSAAGHDAELGSAGFEPVTEGSHIAPESVAAPRTPLPVAVNPFGFGAAPNIGSAPGWTASAVDEAPPRRKPRAWPLLVLAAAAVAVGAVVMLPRLGPSKSAAPAREPTALAERSRPATTPTPAPKIDMVKVRISVDPPDAILTLDGRELSGNPFVATVPKDNAEHELIAVAEACAEHRQMIRFNGDRSLLVAMKCRRQGLRIAARPNKRRAAASAPAPAESTESPQPAGPSEELRTSADEAESNKKP